jgi:hypothetical protein
MKILLLTLLLSTFACAIDGPDCISNKYTLLVWEEPNSDNMVRLSYQADISGWIVYKGCHPDSLAKIVSGSKNWAEVSMYRICSPMYVAVKSKNEMIYELVKI